MRDLRSDMASLRGATQLWTVDDTVAAAGVSAFAHVGTKPYVTVFISNDSGGPLTFGIQVASVGTMTAGLNEVDSTDLPDGGLVWHEYYSWDDPTAAVEIVVADGVPAAFDLSPFAPELMRLSCTEGAGAGEIIASVTASGPN